MTRIVHLLGDADLGLADDDLKRLASEFPSSRPKFRELWLEVAGSSPPKECFTAAHADFAKTPLVALREHVPQEHVPQKGVDLLLLHTQEFTKQAQLFTQANLEQAGLDFGKVETRLVEEFSMRAARAASRAAAGATVAEQHADEANLLDTWKGLRDEIEQVIEAGEQDLQEREIIVHSIGTGSSNLSIGSILAWLETDRVVKVFDVRDGKELPFALEPNPRNWLIRRRYFGAVPEDSPEEREILDRLEKGRDLGFNPPPPIEQVFFDHVAGRSVQAVFMGRAWAMWSFVQRGGNPYKPFQNNLDKLQMRGMGQVLADLNNNTRQSQTGAGKFLKDVAFLNSRATDSKGAVEDRPHRMRRLNSVDGFRLKSHAEEAHKRDFRRIDQNVAPYLRFPTTSTKSIWVVRCQGMQEGTAGGAMNAGISQAKASINETVYGVALQADEAKDIELVMKSIPIVDAEQGPDFRCIQEAVDPMPDALVFVAGPGLSGVQLLALVECAKVCIEQGIPLYVGSLRHDPHTKQSVLDLDPDQVATLPGWDETLFELAASMVCELDLEAAADVVRYSSGADARMQLAERLVALALRLKTHRASPDLGDAEQRVALIVECGLANEDPVAAVMMAMAAIELAISPSHVAWQEPKLKDLKNARNQLVTSHGRGTITKCKARDLLNSVRETLENLGGGVGHFAV